VNYQIKNINNQNFKKFGDLISIKEKNYDEINKKTTNSFSDLANIQIEGEDKRSRLNIFEAKKRIFPLQINMLENHPYSSQVFLPFLNTTFLVLVAPIAIKPNLDEIEIFKVSDGDGINFNPKVWHFPLISLDNAKYITIDKKDAQNNIEIYNFDKSEIFELNYE
jgi:ureidoglycolate lyase